MPSSDYAEEGFPGDKLDEKTRQSNTPKQKKTIKFASSSDQLNDWVDH
ncbi:MAG: hypothetical protein KQI35_16570 [Bacteroidetes bacterium]|nr:hypothetical protein [Bacteroidota bacterium]